MMETLRIKLTPSELKLLDRIELEASALKDHEHRKRNGNLVVALFKSLKHRNAIPDHRRRYFTDADFNVSSRRGSRLAVFERNDCRGEEILRHARFLAYLRYFLHGPDLPTVVIEKFAQAVNECGMVTSGDVIPLCNLARHLARGRRMEPREVCEEFFKLALETGLSPSYASFIRKSVQRIRYS